MNILLGPKKLIKNNFHALSHKNFRYFWLGQCVSLIGTWMQNVGQSWLVLSLTNSPFLLGLLGAIQFLPITLFSLFAGVIIDKTSKKKILLITQATSMILAFMLALLVFTNNVKYSYVLILALILGIVNTIDMPTRQSFTIEIAGKDDLMNAIALNSAIFNLARILGPSVGALLMAYFGAGWCFLFNGISFIAVIYGLLKIKIDNNFVRKVDKNKNIIKEIKDGLKYIKDNAALMQTILMVLIVGIFVFNYNILIPVFAKATLHGGEKVYGNLMAALGIGSLCGAMTVSVKSKSGPKSKTMFMSSIIISLMFILISFTSNYYVSIILIITAGIFNIAFSTTANSTLQMKSKDEYRGRVMSVYSLVFAGATPIGNLFVGTMADKIGGGDTFRICGIIIIITMIPLWFLFQKKVKNN